MTAAGGGGEQPTWLLEPPPSEPRGGGAAAHPRALIGSALAVAGVLLGIGSLLLVTDDPSSRLGPVVRDEPRSLAQSAPPETEPAPVDPAGPPPAPSAPPADEAGPTLAPPGGPAAAPAPSAPPPSAGAGTVDGQAPAPTTARRPLIVPITVLNNSRRPGLAERAAARFDRGGWPVKETGNFRGQIPVTTVYYDPGMEASARAFAASFEGIVRVRPRFATLPARGVVVVLTRDFAA